MNYNSATYSKFIKIIIVKILLLIIIFTESAFSKPIPPGSGEGDVPANILILLDNSKSMGWTVTEGAGIQTVMDVVELDSGDLILAQGRRKGLVKIIWDTEALDTNFADTDGAGGNAPNIRFRGLTSDPNCGGKNSVLKSNPSSLGIAKIGDGDITNDIIYANDSTGKKIVAIDVDGNCVDVINFTQQIRALTVRTFEKDSIKYDHLIAVGKSTIYSKNLTTGISKDCGTGGDIGHRIKGTTSIALDGADETPGFLYIVQAGHIYRYKVEETGDSDTNYCPKTGRNHLFKHHNTHNNKHRYAQAIEMDTDSDSIIYVASKRKHKIQKLTITGNPSFTSTAQRGESRQKKGTTSDAKVYIFRPMGLFVGRVNESAGGNKLLYAGDKKPSVESFDKDASNLTWEDAVGGSRTTRLKGAKAAITAVVADTSLTSGANFGYGNWSAGDAHINEHHAHWGRRGIPNYYHRWEGTVEDGTSIPCRRNACIRVGIHKEGFSKIPAALASTVLVFGTDARAFAELASEYYNGTASPHDPNSSCQQNYVIVIGDGRFWNESPESRGGCTNGCDAEAKIEELRHSLGVKTLMVAYGGGISTLGMEKFDAMAIKGSCDTAGAGDCEGTIIADTPQQLKTQLKSKIQQIIAERLSFTAPSITATIEEGGSLYQAQFNYEQHQEWKGTILRKEIKGDGTVEHSLTHPGNWDAGLVVRGQATRKIWTTLPTQNYIGNWDNFTEANADDIENLFSATDHEVLDYHRTTATTDGSTVSMRCKTAGDVEDGTDDDIKGLISFVRGADYFDYDGDCNLDEKREHVLGDLYHSQIISVSSPKASIEFSNTNQEAYWRSINSYLSFATTHENRQEILYAGGNDGMLHAFDAETGREEWAFIPPFVASQMPTVMNINLNQDSGGGSNAIFGVDGSPVIHDMFFKGRDSDGELETSKNWHTIMIIPYGRGGAGYSVLDITNPTITGTKGPLHLYSFFNDSTNHQIYFADHEGNIEPFEYVGQYYNLSDSEESVKARENEADAENIELNFECETSSTFRIDGTKSCYTGKKWHFELPIRGEALTGSDFEIFELSTDGDRTEITDFTISNVGATTIITFDKNNDFTASQAAGNLTSSSSVNIQITNAAKTGVVDKPEYDYSKMGETWSTPRIIRLPNDGAGDANINDDIYVAIMGGGMGSAFNKAGSNIFIINLEDEFDPGKIEKIIDIEDSDESDLSNSIPASPVVITPDLTVGITWRGALVYSGDLEGKITKINLTNMVDDGMKPIANPVNLYDHTTIFNLGSSVANGRYMYHSMDATIGRDTREFWLYGGTGDYERINDVSSPLMDNILIGIKDEAYPYYREVLSTKVADLTECSDTTSDTTGALCPTSNDAGWVIHLSDYKKVTAEPTIYRGNVYYPIYRPDPGLDRCKLGTASVCGVNDECGTNISSELKTGSGSSGGFADEQCLVVGRGILSELVVFGDTLFANIAGPSDTKDTLVSVKAAPGEIDNYRNSWKQNY